MFSAISSMIFAYRNVGKTQNGEIGRAPVAAAQAIGVIDEVARYNATVAKGADAAVSVFNNLAGKSKVMKGVVKATKWGVNNVNPLICVSSGIKIATADDKASTAIKEVGALSAMFAGEAIAKRAIPEIVKKLPVGGKVGAVIKGLAFVGASIASYAIGEKMGNDLAKELKTDFGFSGHKKINQMA